MVIEMLTEVRTKIKCLKVLNRNNRPEEYNI